MTDPEVFGTLLLVLRLLRNCCADGPAVQLEVVTAVALQDHWSILLVHLASQCSVANVEACLLVRTALEVLRYRS